MDKGRSRNQKLQRSLTVIKRILQQAMRSSDACESMASMPLLGGNWRPLTLTVDAIRPFDSLTRRECYGDTATTPQTVQRCLFPCM